MGLMIYLGQGDLHSPNPLSSLVLTNISSYGTMDCALTKSIYYLLLSIVFASEKVQDESVLLLYPGFLRLQ